MTDEYKKIIDAIGKAQPDDKDREPEKHAQNENYPAHLKDFLLSEPLHRRLGHSKKAGARARELQQQVNGLVDRARVFLTIGAGFSAILAASDYIRELLKMGEDNPWLAIIITLFALTFNTLSTISLDRLGRLKLLPQRVAARGLAEEYKIKYFKFVTRIAERMDWKEVAYRFEYYIRYRFFHQMNYYAKASDKHTKKASSLISGELWLAGLASIITSAIVIIDIAQGTVGFVSLTAVALVFTTWSTYFSNKEAFEQNQVNAERYNKARNKLVGICNDQLDDVREKLAKGDFSYMKQCVEAIDEVFAVEHQEWMDGSTYRQSSIDQLRKMLEKKDDNSG